MRVLSCAYRELMDRTPLFNDTARKMLSFKYYNFYKTLSVAQETKADKKVLRQFQQLNTKQISYIDKIRYKI